MMVPFIELKKMKKVILIALFGIISISAFSQNKKEVLKPAIIAASDSSLTFKKEQAIELYKLMEYCKEAISTTISKKITVADAASVMANIVEVQKIIAERYQPKQPENTSIVKPKE